MTRARLAEALADLLAERPGLNAKQLVAGLLNVGLTVNRTAVNSVLYSDPAFRNDGTTPPRWRLAVEAAPAPAAAPVPAGPAPTPKPAATPGLRLYGWQEDALAAWRDQGEHGVVEAVTGTGKTMVGIAAALDTLRCRQKVCVLVPTRELMAQWAAQLRKQVPPHTRIGKLGDGSQRHVTDLRRARRHRATRHGTGTCRCPTAGDCSWPTNSTAMEARQVRPPARSVRDLRPL